MGFYFFPDLDFHACLVLVKMFLVKSKPTVLNSAKTSETIYVDSALNYQFNTSVERKP